MNTAKKGSKFNCILQQCVQTLSTHVQFNESTPPHTTPAALLFHAR